MLLAHQRRQHPSTTENHHQFSNLSIQDLPLRTSTSSSHFLSPVPAESDVAKLSHSPSSTLESSPAISNLDFSEPSDYYMPRGYSQGQPVRSHPSSSRPASTQPPSSSLSTLSDGGRLQQQASWTPPSNAAHLISHPRSRFPEQYLHKRNLSDSTATSSGPQSPFTPVSAASQPLIVDQDSQAYFSQHFESFDHHGLPSVTSYPKALPTTGAPFSDSLIFSPQFQNFSPQYADNQTLWEQAMSQEMTQQQQQQRQQGHRSSGYRMNQPQRPSGDFNALRDMGANNHANFSRSATVERSKVPNLDRTMSDIYQDELYNPEEPTVPAPISQASTAHVKNGPRTDSPRNSVFSERLQAAGQEHISARSASPGTVVSREKSPFRPTSEYAAEAYAQPAGRGSRLGSAAKIREHQRTEAEALAMAQHTQPREVVNEKTVSPKEVSLEYEPENDGSAPLISDFHQSPTQLHNARSQRPSRLNQELSRPEQEDYDPIAQLRRESSSNLSTGSNSLQSGGGPRVPQQYPFVAHQRRPNNSHARPSQESVPEFPAHMPSMESTKSERQSVSPQSSPRSSSSESDVQRPEHTSADTGTYSCTYHGCTQRFDTFPKLQKHKREGHKAGTPNSASGSENRGTQAGPHKCERINPSTGKPCNSIFSRPYDLTRHEDTIHNARKQKVRCQHCVEEKTFSRSDALTRHMRVVHPEIEFSGKISKRGRG